MGRILPTQNRDMMFYEERERMRNLIKNSSVNMGTSGEMGTSGRSYPLTGSTFDPNLYTVSGTTQSFGSTEVKSKKLIPNIQPIESEREKVKASWKFWKK